MIAREHRFDRPMPPDLFPMHRSPTLLPRSTTTVLIGWRATMAGVDATAWCEKSLTAVLSLWDDSRNQAWRGSQEHRAQQLKGAKDHLRPTATFNAILAF